MILKKRFLVFLLYSARQTIFLLSSSFSRTEFSFNVIKAPVAIFISSFSLRFSSNFSLKALTNEA